MATDDREPRPGGDRPPVPAPAGPAAARAETPAAAAKRRAEEAAARVRAERRRAESKARRETRRGRRRQHLRLAVRLPGVLWRALLRAFSQPGAVALFLLLNLGVAAILAMPYRGLLHAELDDNLYGEAMETGASWRWYDTVERRDPRALGDVSALPAFFTSAGVRWKDLAALSGPPAAIALAAAILFFLHAVLHVGWLAVGRWKGGRGGGVAALLHRAAVFAPPALALAAVAAAAYAGAYALAFVATGPPLERLAENLRSERLHLALVGLRLALTGLLVVLVKIAFDLAKVALVETGSWKWWSALARAAGELARRGWAYLLLYLLLGLGTLGIAALWWLVSAPLVPQSLLGIAILFLLHQLVVALRVALRLAGLSAVQGTWLSAAGIAADDDEGGQIQSSARITPPSSTR